MDLFMNSLCLRLYVLSPNMGYLWGTALEENHCEPLIYIILGTLLRNVMKL